MQKCKIKFTLFFEDPFWVGHYERVENDKLYVCKITFGAEPKDYEVYEFLLFNWGRLRFGPAVKTASRPEVYVNPKRMQRKIKKQLDQKGTGTKSQQALKLLQEENKTTRKQKSKSQKEAEKERQFELRTQKRKAKHKGK